GKRDSPFASVPVTWPELARAAKKKNAQSLFFSPAEALQRVKRLGDLFAPVLEQKQRLPKSFASATEKKPVRPTRSLQSYAQKRDFTRTAEPKPAIPRGQRRGAAPRFVIQKHAARNLHYDFRLEMDGTLKSWAVPKGVPYELGVKRSAFQVEDHPVDYLEFEGTIPQSQYGGGTVMVWDIGTYDLLEGSWDSGKLKLRLKGRKLKGEWHLFRIRSDENKPVWLIAKSGAAMKPLTARQDDTSALTRRSMARIAKENTAQWESGRRHAAG
ncbi:MAG TPA: DNA polymerase ligase N-terminal domain-containing protein, partial [Candidatus Didemnitutus sp.]|nr:DNA polymerase ligase N-terminal domain-containing protein [Candidatus Didemnitutus sp.]